MTKNMELTSEPRLCIPRSLPAALREQAAHLAIEINPEINAPFGMPHGHEQQDGKLAAVAQRYWGRAGIQLTVGFLDSPPAELRARILSHMNAWSKTANVHFVESQTDPQVRIARASGVAGGYWSYLGTDILVIPKDQPTMNLEGFTMATPESEFCRVVRHEAGHTLGFPHEHLRSELVARLSPEKVLKYYMDSQGWSAEEVRFQVLTPIQESSLIGSPSCDADSIMCYQIPGDLTRDEKPIIGGKDLSHMDYEIVAKLYPKPQ